MSNFVLQIFEPIRMILASSKHLRWLFLSPKLDLTHSFSFFIQSSDVFTRKSPLCAAEAEAEATTPGAPVRGRLAVLVGVVATAKRPANRGQLVFF